MAKLTGSRRVDDLRAFPGRLAAVTPEPRVVFFVAGALIFGLYAPGRGPEGGREPEIIAVTEADIPRLTTVFEATRQRVPTAVEIATLVREHVDKAFAREALALGLDRGDAVIRQRLRPKMLFIAGFGRRRRRPRR